MIQEEPEVSGQVTDAVKGNWVDRLPFEFPKPYLRLSRADRPIGTWLLFIPCTWGALLAFVSQDGLISSLVWGSARLRRWCFPNAWGRLYME